MLSHEVDNCSRHKAIAMSLAAQHPRQGSSLLWLIGMHWGNREPLSEDILGATTQRDNGSYYPKRYWELLPKEILGATTPRDTGMSYGKMEMDKYINENYGLLYSMRPTLLKSDESGMGLLDFVKFADSFKVKTRERKLVKGELSLITKTVDVVVAPSAQTDEDVVISKHVPTTAGKSLTALKRLELQSGPQGNESGSAPHATEEFMSYSVTLSLEPDVPEDSGSTQDVNVQTHRVPKRVVVATSSFEHGDTDVSLRVKSPLSHIKAKNIDARFTDGAGDSSIPGDNTKTSTSTPDEGSHVDEFFESQTINSTTTQNIYVPEWSVNNDARVENPIL
ncbi:hypothetical protein Tco_0929135, partial [Tanacetum coccineum]